MCQQFKQEKCFGAHSERPARWSWRTWSLRWLWSICRCCSKNCHTRRTKEAHTPGTLQKAFKYYYYYYYCPPLRVRQRYITLSVAVAWRQPCVCFFVCYTSRRQICVKLTTKLLSLGLEVSVIPSLILSFRSDTLVRDILPWGRMKLIGRILDARIIRTWIHALSFRDQTEGPPSGPTGFVVWARLTGPTHVQPVWRRMRRAVWCNSRVETSVNNLENTVKRGMIGMAATLQPDTCHREAEKCADIHINTYICIHMRVFLGYFT